MFPLSIEGTVEFAAIEPQEVPRLVTAISAALQRARATDISSTGDTVTFRGGGFRWVTNWNALVPISSGVVHIRAGTPGNVAFRFSCVQMLTIVSLMALFAAVVTAAKKPLSLGLGAAAFIWLSLFGLNYLIAKVRLPAFIRRALNARAA
jgi:hypothetical protein